MIKKIVFFLNYGHLEKKMSSVIVSQNHYFNKIFDVHPLVSIILLLFGINYFPIPRAKLVDFQTKRQTKRQTDRQTDGSRTVVPSQKSKINCFCCVLMF